MNSVSHILSGKTRALRPWAEASTTTCLFADPDTLPPPPKNSSERRTTLAAINNQVLADFVQTTGVELVNKSKISPAIEGWESLAARDIKGQAQIYRQVNLDESTNSIADWYLEGNEDRLMECALPSRVPWEFVSAIVLSKDEGINADFITKISCMQLPDGRALKDLLVVCNSQSDSIQWQKAYFQHAWEALCNSTDEVDEFVPLYNQRQLANEIPVEDVQIRACCGGGKKKYERAVATKVKKALDERERRQELLDQQQQEHSAFARNHRQQATVVDAKAEEILKQLYMFGGG
jgi:hypothetical protein